MKLKHFEKLFKSKITLVSKIEETYLPTIYRRIKLQSLMLAKHFKVTLELYPTYNMFVSTSIASEY